MSKKRFLSIFAVLFVIIFSVACVFTACGKSNDDDSGDKGSDTTTEEPETSETPGTEPSEEETVYTVIVTGDNLSTGTTTDYALALGITDGDEGDVFGSATLTASLLADSTAVDGATAQWASSDGSIATVTNGAITAVANGETTVTVTYYAEDGTTELAKATIAVTVTDSRTTEPPATGTVYTITVTGDTLTTGTTGDYALSLEITDGTGDEDDVYGSATLTASLLADSTAVDGATAQWASSDGSVATVTNGTITAVAAGTTTITVTYYAVDGTKEFAKATIAVTVTDSRTTEPEPNPEPSEPTVESITLSQNSLTLALDEQSRATGTITATVAMSDSSPFAGQLTISEVSGVTFTQSDSDGTITITATATTAISAQTVTVSAGEKSETFTLTVEAYVAPEPELTGVTLDPATLALDLNGTTTSTITATTANSDYSYTWAGNEWSSSDESVATVSANGNTATVTAVGVGTATITVKLSDTISATCEVTVTNSSPTEPETTYIVTVTGAETVRVNGQITLTATVTTENGTTVENPKITWSVSSDTSSYAIVEADTGVVTGEARGSAYIIASYVDESGNVLATGGKWISVQAASAQVGDGEEYDVEIDFSEASDLTVGTTATTGLDEGDIFTYVDIDLEGKVENGVLETNSFTKYGDTTYTNYILVDFSQFSGYNFEIKITFTSDSSSWGEGQTATKVAIVDALVENADGYGQSSSIFGESAPDLSEVNGQTWTEGDGYVTYTYPLSGSGSVEEYNQTLYIVWDATVKISSISLTLWTGDKPFKLDTDWDGLEIDFADPPSEFTGVYKNNQYVASTVVMGDGVLTLTDLDANVSWASGWNYMATGAGTHTTASTGNTQGETELTDYFTVNLNGLQGEGVVITIVFSTGNGSDGILYLLYETGVLSGDAVDTANVIGSATGSMDKKLSVAFTVPESGLVYIEWESALQIRSISIALGSEVDTNPVYSLEIDTQNAQTSLIVGGDENGSTTLTAMVYIDGTYDAGASAAVTWTSSDPNVATVSGGVVTALKAGDTYITISYNGLESGKILIRVNIVMPEGTVTVDFTDTTAGWGDIITASATSRNTYPLVDGMLTYKAGATQYDHFVGWTADGDGVYALETGDGAAYGSSGWSTAGSGSQDNLINYFTINTSGSTEMTIRIIYSAVSDPLDALVDENASYSYPDTQTGFVALTKGFPETISTTTWWNASGSDEYETKVSYVTNYLLDSDAIKSTNGVGYNNSVVLTWTGSVEDLDKVYIILGSSMYIYSIEIYLDGYAPSTGEGDGDGGDVGGGMVEITETVNFDEEPYKSYSLSSDGKIADLTDILTLYMKQNSSYKTEYVTANDRTALSMSIYSNYDTGNTSPTEATCITIDVSALHGQTITIALECSADSQGRQTYLALGTSMQRNSTSKGSNGILEIVGGMGKTITTTTWNITVPDEYDTLFLYVPGGMYVCYLYSISVTYMAESSGAADESGEDPAAEETTTTIVSVDFSKEETYSWIGTAAGTVGSTSSDVATSGIITLHNGSSTASLVSRTFDDVTYLACNLNAKSASYNSNPTYFKIDVSAYVGQTITVTVNFCSDGSYSSNAATTLALGNATSFPYSSDSTVLESSTSNSTSSMSTLTWTGTVADGMVLTLYCLGSPSYSVPSICSIDVTLG